MNNKQIGEQIVREYVSGIDDQDRAVFQIDGMTVRCKNTASAVSAIAEKFRKSRGHPNPIPQPARVVRRFSITAFRDFTMDGELDNAVEYCKGWGIANLPVEVQALVRSWA